MELVSVAGRGLGGIKGSLHSPQHGLISQVEPTRTYPTCADSEEACSDLRAGPPDFDTCTVPLVLWTRWPYNLAEAFATVYARLQHAVEAGELARTGEVLPVLATPHGLRAPR